MSEKKSTGTSFVLEIYQVLDVTGYKTNLVSTSKIVEKIISMMHFSISKSRIIVLDIYASFQNCLS